jgi:hypothetical protein
MPDPNISFPVVGLDCDFTRFMCVTMDSIDPCLSKSEQLSDDSCSTNTSFL